MDFEVGRTEQDGMATRSMEMVTANYINCVIITVTQIMVHHNVLKCIREYLRRYQADYETVVVFLLVTEISMYFIHTHKN
jgi:hypothetical protein